MPRIHPKTWEDGVMPLSEFPEWKQQEIAAAVASPVRPRRWLDFVGCQMESRAWYEWHWARGRKLVLIPGTGRRKLPAKLRMKVLQRDGYVCGICSGEVETGDVHIDHIFPVAAGGTDDLDNLQVAHSRCNMRKGAKV